MEDFIDLYNKYPIRFKTSFSLSRLGVTNTQERYNNTKIPPIISPAGNGWYWG
ncbi:hypothetical protein MBAV_000713, partial [Candidatus Magnetobacterium bavaricum]